MRPRRRKKCVRRKQLKQKARLFQGKTFQLNDLPHRGQSIVDHGLNLETLNIKPHTLTIPIQNTR